MAEKDLKPLTFLTLPREIRDIIYQKVLAKRCYVRIKQLSKENGQGGEASTAYRPQWLAILRTNHQVREEAIAAFYRSIQFRFDFVSLTKFKSYDLGFLNLTSVRHMRIGFSIDPKQSFLNKEIFLKYAPEELEALQTEFPNLKTLEMEFLNMICDPFDNAIVNFPETFHKSLWDFNAQIRTIPTLRSIAAIFYFCASAGPLGKFMRTLGWKVIIDRKYGSGPKYKMQIGGGGLIELH